MPYLKCHARVKQGHVVGECREVDYGKSPGVDAEYGEKSVISPRASVEAENAQQVDASEQESYRHGQDYGAQERQSSGGLQKQCG